MNVLYFLVLLAALQVADWLTTRAILKRGGCELNPVIKALIRLTGNADAALIGKGVVAMGMAYLLWEAGPSFAWVIQALCALYAGVVAWNAAQLAKPGRR